MTSSIHTRLVKRIAVSAIKPNRKGGTHYKTKVMRENRRDYINTKMKSVIQAYLMWFFALWPLVTQNQLFSHTSHGAFTSERKWYLCHCLRKLHHCLVLLVFTSWFEMSVFRINGNIIFRELSSCWVSKSICAYGLLSLFFSHFNFVHNIFRVLFLLLMKWCIFYT